ncbi:hypothetical protein Hanom_Chr10g00873221 [Helianthus anomalus]
MTEGTLACPPRLPHSSTTIVISLSLSLSLSLSALHSLVCFLIISLITYFVFKPMNEFVQINVTR